MSKKKCKPRSICIFGLQHKIQRIKGEGYKCIRCGRPKAMCHD